MEVLLERIPTEKERLKAETRLTTAVSYLNLASVLYELKHYQRALELARQARAVFQQTLLEGHPRIELAVDWCEGIGAEMGQQEG